jgi:hypothetical protein
MGDGLDSRGKGVFLLTGLCLCCSLMLTLICLVGPIVVLEDAKYDQVRGTCTIMEAARIDSCKQMKFIPHVQSRDRFNIQAIPSPPLFNRTEGWNLRWFKVQDEKYLRFNKYRPMDNAYFKKDQRTDISKDKACWWTTSHTKPHLFPDEDKPGDVLHKHKIKCPEPSWVTVMNRQSSEIQKEFEPFFRTDDDIRFLSSSIECQHNKSVAKACWELTTYDEKICGGNNDLQKCWNTSGKVFNCKDFEKCGVCCTDTSTLNSTLKNKVIHRFSRPSYPIINNVQFDTNENTSSNAKKCSCTKLQTYPVFGLFNLKKRFNNFKEWFTSKENFQNNLNYQKNEWVNDDSNSNDEVPTKENKVTSSDQNIVSIPSPVDYKEECNNVLKYLIRERQVPCNCYASMNTDTCTTTDIGYQGENGRCDKDGSFKWTVQVSTPGYDPESGDSFSLLKETFWNGFSLFFESGYFSHTHDVDWRETYDPLNYGERRSKGSPINNTHWHWDAYRKRERHGPIIDSGTRTYGCMYGLGNEYYDNLWNNKYFGGREYLIGGLIVFLPCAFCLVCFWCKIIVTVGGDVMQRSPIHSNNYERRAKVKKNDTNDKNSDSSQSEADSKADSDAINKNEIVVEMVPTSLKE